MANLKDLIVNGVSRFIGKVFINDSHINTINDVEVGTSPKFTDTTALESMTGILGVNHGGTGKTSGKDAANYFMNALDTGSSTPVDADYYISQYVGGGVTTTTFHRRPVSALWSYIKEKIDAIGLDFRNCGSKQVNVVLTKGTTSTSKAILLRDKTNNADIWAYDTTFQYFHVYKALESERQIFARLGYTANIFFRFPETEVVNTYNSMIRNDGKMTYFLLTDALDEFWNNLRPFTIDNATGSCVITGTISSSDRNKKHDIQELDERFLDFFDRLTPVGYKWNTGTSGRQHAGFIAQDVKDALDASNIDSSEFAGYVEIEDMDGKSYGLRYDQFIPILTKKIQEQQRIINEQKIKIDNF